MKSVFKRPLLFFPLFFIVLQALTAQTSGGVSADGRSLLWEIKGKSLSKPSYLYGTIHLIGKSDFFITEATEKAFGETQRVAFEIDLEEMGDFSTLMPLLMQSFMKNDTTLSDLLLPEEYSAVKAHFGKLGLPMFLLDRIKPMFLTALDPRLWRPGEAEEETVSYEIEFLRMAQEADKPIDGLETAAFQMSMFDSIPYRVQARMLVDMVKGNPEEAGNQEFQQMVELYKNQDIEGMQGMLGADKEIAAFENLLLVNRNRKWIPIMEKMMSEKPTFFAVGAGHLGGPQGVVQLLRDSGYSLTPLK
ncbi:MAG: TraB/GumN family protein [Haliscomenobacter sp.]|nr:TraB/GumN family protein [Haliscomenobacter sp.]